MGVGLVWLMSLVLSRALPVLLCVAFLTLTERGTLSSMQRRLGPEISGTWGLLQPFWDGLKLAMSEPMVPSGSSSLFVWAPVLSFALAQMVWCVLPAGSAFGLVDWSSGMVAVAGLSTLAVFGVLLAGWASNSKYAFLGGCRSAAGMISYELPLGVVTVVLVSMGRDVTSGTHHASLVAFIEANREVWLGLPLWSSLVVWLVLTLAETKRAPFDLPEAEAELVAGFNVEYSSMGFALFFLGEYASMLAMSALGALVFMHDDGGSVPLAPKLCCFSFLSFGCATHCHATDQTNSCGLGGSVFCPWC
jgi:NADH-quinone oxidoreductase subunit H